MVNHSADIAQGDFVKRIPYPTNIISVSQQAVEKAVAENLGGKDTADVPLWWDVD